MSGAGSGHGGERRASYKEAVNARLARRIERLPKAACSGVAVSALFRLAAQADQSGRLWFPMSRLPLTTKHSERATREAIVDASANPGLIYFARPNPRVTLPWPSRPTPDAWAFWVPDAALALSEAEAHARCARSIAEHLAGEGARLWPVHGAGLSELLLLAADAAPSSSATVEEPEAVPAVAR